MTKKSAPWLPPAYEDAHVVSLQALARGEAKPHEQKLALDWIIATAGTYDLSFRPESDRETAFAEGKRFVGLQLVKLLNTNLK